MDLTDLRDRYQIMYDHERFLDLKFLLDDEVLLLIFNEHSEYKEYSE